MTRVLARNDAKISFLEGADTVARLVAPTFGPSGRAVLSSRQHIAPVLLRSGYAITSEVEFEAFGLRAGAAAMRQVAIDVHAEVGDGTTLALLLAREFLFGLNICVESGISVPRLHDAVLSHVERLVAELEVASVPVSDAAALERIATRAAGGDAAIGAIIRAAHEAAGADGVVLVEASHGARDETTVEAGMTFAQAWPAHPFLEAGDGRLVLSNPLILLHQGAIESFDEMARILEMIAQSGKELLVVADRFGPEAVATLRANREERGLKVVPMVAAGTGPWRGRLLEDLAVWTGSTIIGDTVGSSLRGLRPAMLGRAGRVEMTRHVVSVIDGRGETAAIAARCAGIRQSIEEERYLSFDREQHQRRLARFVANVVTLRLGGRSSAELALRLEAAKAASTVLRAVAAEGAVPGGPAALSRAAARCAGSLGEDPLGRALARVFRDATRVPLIAAADNAGLEGRSVAYQIENEPENVTFDVETRGLVPAGDALEPRRVLIAALRAAVSFAASAVTIDHLIGR